MVLLQLASLYTSVKLRTGQLGTWEGGFLRSDNRRCLSPVAHRKITYCLSVRQSNKQPKVESGLRDDPVT